MRSSLRLLAHGGMLAAAILTALLADAGAAQAAEPSVGAIVPWGAQRGTEVDVEFRGGRLADAQELMFAEPGIEVAHLEASDGTVKTRLKIADDCRVGLHSVRVRTASGVSNLRLFSVGALPVVDEIEPNNEFPKPQPIALGTTVHGIVAAEDIDYFVVEAKAGQRITAEVEGLRLGYSFFDPHVAILDERRFELATSDDAPLLRQDAYGSIVAPEDGRYIITVRESAFGGGGDAYYRLHVGSYPRPTAVLPPGGRPGETLKVRWLGDVAGPREETVTLPAGLNDEAGLAATDEHGVAPTAVPIRIGELANVPEQEPNGSRETATPFSAPAAPCGVIAEPGQVDHFVFEASKGQAFDVRVHARSLRSPLDPVLVIERIGGAGVASNDDSGGPDSYVRFTAPEDDRYVISVRDHLGKGGADYVYRVEVTPVRPQLTMGLPERQQYVAQTLIVPRGNRMAVMVSAGRQDFGGGLVVEVRDLPPGMKFETLPMAANRADVPVLFTAEADAAPAGKLADVVGRATDENLAVEGRLRQRNWLVRGQNNADVYSHWTDRVPAVVAEAAPFHIEIVEPRVPLVRNGSMDLKIVARRAEGFTAPIEVFMLYNPPGVASSGGVSIAEGQSEAILPLTANSGAELNDWKIVVIGRAGVGGGAVEVASQLATLRVTEPYVNLAFDRAAAEQGQAVDVLVKVETKTAFDGAARVELVGLPGGVTTEPLELTKDTEALVFRVQTSADSPPGKHTTLVCRAVVTENGEPILHTFGGGELRIDTPLPPKADAPPQPKPAEVAEAKPAERQLSRLERLRLEREQQQKQQQPPQQP